MNPAQRGTKARGVVPFDRAPARRRSPLAARAVAPDSAVRSADCRRRHRQRRAEADDILRRASARRPPDGAATPAPGVAGLLWTQEVLPVRRRAWLAATGEAAAPARGHGRNRDWPHVYVADIISMPDAWEYPWFAAWDLAFHASPMAMVDIEFAKKQLKLMLSEWYMHPNGQIPAYEWAFSDSTRPCTPGPRSGSTRSTRAQTGKGDRIPRARLPQAAHQLRLVGQPQGRRGQQRLRRRLPRARQHLALRPAASRCPTADGSSRPTRRPGWRCTASI